MGFGKFLKKMGGAFGIGTTCPDCGESIKGASYQFRSVKTIPGSANVSPQVEVRFDYECPHCHKKNDFTKKFIWYDGVDMQTKIELWAEKHFGH